MNFPFDLLARPGRHGWRLLLAFLAATLCLQAAHAVEMPPGHHYWYVPEHENYVKTEFFTKPSFRSAAIKFQHTERFTYVSGQRGWARLQFDNGTEAYIHLRILRSLLYDPAAHDPWSEFQRASVFAEPPKEIEARLKPPPEEPKAASSKLPVWKRYKESWSINRGRSHSDTADGDGLASPARPQEKKSRSKLLLPPLEPPAESSP